MLTDYISSTLKKSRFKRLEDGSVFGEIQGVKGVWANARTQAACKKELQEVFEDWLVLQLYTQQKITGLRVHTSLTKMPNKNSAVYA